MDYMKINPYVRYARHDKGIMFDISSVARDHRILLCLSDNAKIMVADKIYTLTKGTVIMYKAGVPYREVSDGEKMEYLGINFDYCASESYTKAVIPQVKEQYFNDSMIIEKRDNEIIKSIPDCICVNSPIFKEMFEEVIYEYQKKNLYFEERCSALLKDIIITVLRLDSKNKNHIARNNASQRVKYVHSHYMEDITNVYLAKKFSYHPGYIGQMVRSLTGMTLHKYLIYLRINKSVEYLQSGQYNITEVAELVGYKDIKHFSKSFKQVTGLSPSTYLK